MRIEEEIAAIMKSKNNELIKKIISVFSKEKLANLNIKDGLNILPYYVRENNLEIVEYLIEKGCNIHRLDRTGDNLFYEICESDDENMELFQYLLEKGVDVHHTSYEGNTPLIWAAFYEKWNFVVRILEEGVDSSKKNDCGNTFGFYLSEKGNAGWISYFLENENLFTPEEVKLLKTKRLELIMK